MLTRGEVTRKAVNGIICCFCTNIWKDIPPESGADRVLALLTQAAEHCDREDWPPWRLALMCYMSINQVDECIVLLKKLGYLNESGWFDE